MIPAILPLLGFNPGGNVFESYPFLLDIQYLVICRNWRALLPPASYLPQGERVRN